MLLPNPKFTVVRYCLLFAGRRTGALRNSRNISVSLG